MRRPAIFKELLFISGSREAIAVDISVSSDGSLRAGRARKLFDINPVALTFQRNTWEVTPDGQKFLVNSFQQTTATVTPLTVVVNWLGGANATR